MQNEVEGHETESNWDSVLSPLVSICLPVDHVEPLIDTRPVVLGGCAEPLGLQPAISELTTARPEARLPVHVQPQRLPIVTE
jgi:hypothetical protein